MIYLGPDPRSPLDMLAADPRVTLSATASWLEAEAGDER